MTNFRRPFTTITPDWSKVIFVAAFELAQNVSAAMKRLRAGRMFTPKHTVGVGKCESMIGDAECNLLRRGARCRCVRDLRQAPDRAEQVEIKHRPVEAGAGKLQLGVQELVLRDQHVKVDSQAVLERVLR